MAFFITSSPHTHTRRKTPDVMKWVAITALPGLLAQVYFFGWGTLVQLILGIALALIMEFVVAVLRKRAPGSMLNDYSAIVTAWLLAVAIPPLAPWWMITIGLLFAIIVAKQLYGGLGQNPFNPAMIGYIVLLIAFPLQMTSWLPPMSLSSNHSSVLDAIKVIFTGYNGAGLSVQQLRLGVDGVTMATPLDTIKTSLHAGLSLHDALSKPQFGAIAGIGWQWVNIAYLIGGMVLLKLKVIQWHIPVTVIAGLVLSSFVGHLLSPETISSPVIHLFSGATMLGAFFIATDPVTASTTIKGRLIFGLFIGVMIFIIRTWGGFPDGVAFAVLLGNMGVPLIDYYTKPRTYGH
ncbi:electron transport complex subunit RsxD [Vibrio salinus]|uniref:electron transport complex subunit RsxD n=1 Tax=Vibrio salinus TaxID=2899784 RepID=UPI001E405D76|nr:electron transport complex subunit RsxD [Vibrio salinus]MCE0492966.1 electron transport complex subunit RsxD [Vibrio salinus]